MMRVQRYLYCGGHHEVGAKGVYTIGVTVNAGAKLFTLWGSP